MNYSAVRQAKLLTGVALSVALLAVVTGCGSEPPPSTQPPYLNKFLVKASPKGTYEATYYNYGKGGSGYLGATVTSTMYVNVRRREEPFDPEQGQVFAMRHAYRLRLVWKDERNLRIDFNASKDDVELKRAKSGEVSIVFRPVPANQLPDAYPALPSPGIPGPVAERRQ